MSIVAWNLSIANLVVWETLWIRWMFSNRAQTPTKTVLAIVVQFCRTVCLWNYGKQSLSSNSNDWSKRVSKPLFDTRHSWKAAFTFMMLGQYSSLLSWAWSSLSVTAPSISSKPAVSLSSKPCNLLLTSVNVYWMSGRWASETLFKLQLLCRLNHKLNTEKKNNG